MRKIYTLIGIISIILFITGCKTAAKLYDKGNYDEAVELAAKKLQKKPDDAETRSLLLSAYHYAINDHETRIRQHSNSTNELKWEWIYGEYQSLQRLYEAIYRSPEAMSIIRPTDYSSYLNTYADKAADVRYSRGIAWMNKGDKLSFRNAYSEFDLALRYRPGDLDVTDLRNEAYENAVVNVVVTPLDNYRYRYSSYNNSNLWSFENDIIRQLKFNSGNRFVRFFTPGEAAGLNIQPDQFIDFRFSFFNIGKTRDERSVREVSREVVVKETVYRHDSIVKEYKKVFAKITSTKRTMVSDGTMQIIVRDAFGNRLWTDNVNGDHYWWTEFSTYTGDERALSDADKALVNRRPNFPPYEDEITRHIINEISNNVSGRMRNYLSRL